MTEVLAAQQLSVGEVTSFVGTVKSKLDGLYLVADSYGRATKAQTAVSCLVTPVVGDRVLAVQAESTVYLLAVLEREKAVASTIALQGDVKMSVPSGKLEINARDGMTLSTPNELSLIAETVQLGGKALAAAFSEMNLSGQSVQAQLNDIRLFGKRLHSKIDSAVQQFVRRQAKVDSIDSLKAGTIKQTAKDLLTLRSAFAFFKARKNVKIDGKQIFMG